MKEKDFMALMNKRQKKEIAEEAAHDDERLLESGPHRGGVFSAP